MNKLRFFSVSIMVFAIMAVGVSAEEEVDKEESGLTEDQIESVVDLLVSFDVDEDTIETVRNTLEGKNDTSTEEESDKEESEDDDKEKRSRTEKPELPEAASDRAKQVMACLRITRVLRHGDSGEDVEELQTYLKEKGFFEYPEITGYFGSVTEEAVQSYQASEDIVSGGSPRETGYGQVGPKTRGKIEHATCVSGGVVESEEEEEENGEKEEENGEDEE